MNVEKFIRLIQVTSVLLILVGAVVGFISEINLMIEKKKVDLVLFFLCDMQCCMATVKDNLEKTEKQTKLIAEMAQKAGVKVLFGGSGLQFLPSVPSTTDATFIKYSDLLQIIV